MPPRNKAAHRRLLLRRLIERREIPSQEAILRMLADRGHAVSQTTVSRDLAAIGAVRESLEDGNVLYRLAVPPIKANELGDRLRQFAHEISSSANIVVVHTPPGSAHAVAVALDDARDRGRLPEARGTVAGDDTLCIVTSSATAGGRLSRKLESMLEI